MVGKEKTNKQFLKEKSKRPDFTTDLANFDNQRKFAKPKSTQKSGKDKSKSVNFKSSNKKKDDDRMQTSDSDEFQEPHDKKILEKDLSNRITELAREQLLDEQMEEVDEYNDYNPYMKKFDIESDIDDFSETENYTVEGLDQITEEDEKALEMFMHSGPQKKIDLASLILEKIKEKENATETDVDVKIKNSQDPKVLQVYEGVARLMHSYTFGKLPKAFTIIPALSNWEEILYLTRPEQWSSNAMYKATKIFSSNLSSQMSQRFYNCVLLPAVIDDIRANKKLNYHLFQSLRKALFRPGAFYQGILIPLCESGRCTLREATIVSSVIVRTSIPVLHSAVAILKLAEMEYSGPISFFLNALFQKKYALPLRVIEACVGHFYKARKDLRQRPVLWHQSLLTFVQRYKTTFSPEQRNQIKKLLKFQYHPYFSEEVRRELASTE